VAVQVLELRAVGGGDDGGEVEVLVHEARERKRTRSASVKRRSEKLSRSRVPQALDSGYCARKNAASRSIPACRRSTRGSVAPSARKNWASE
jgi:hypothetical protein